MKKFLSILLCAVLLIIMCSTVCLAEVADVPAPAFTFDVTQVVIALMWLVFNALLLWILKTIIPPAKRWLETHTTTQQQNRVWTVVKWLVEAAEQTIVGPARGSERLAWVIAQLRARGIQVDQAMIEAAVKEMKDTAGDKIAEAIKGDPSCTKDYCELE